MSRKRRLKDELGDIKVGIATVLHLQLALMEYDLEVKGYKEGSVPEIEEKRKHIRSIIERLNK